MGKKKKHKKSGEKDRHLETIILITAILNLLDKLMNIIQKIQD